MPHKEGLVPGWPSVTGVTGLLDKSKYLCPWYGKHGTLKAKALLDACGIIDAMTPVEAIPDSWFKAYKLERTDFWKDGQEMTKAAAERGTKLHDDIQSMFEQYLEPATDSLSAIRRWADIVEAQVIDFERDVKSESCRYYGTYDTRFLIDQKTVLVDWKSGGVYDSHALQLSGYAHAIIEVQGVDAVHSGRIIRPKENKTEASEDTVENTFFGSRYEFAGLKTRIEEYIYPDLGIYFDDFLRLRLLWDFVNRKGQWER